MKGVGPILTLLALALSVEATRASQSVSGPRFELSFPTSTRSQPVTGRAFVMISPRNEPEVRLQDYWFNSPEFLGVDVAQLPPGGVVVIDGHTLGYPFRSLRELPPGDYYVQASLVVYQRYPRADGHVVWASEQWDAHRFSDSSGTLYSIVRKVRLSPEQSDAVGLTLKNVVPPDPVPADTQWVKHVRIQSPLLTRFWGRPIYIGAVVLLPRDYASHRDIRYPVIYQQQMHFNFDAPFELKTRDAPESEADRRQRESRGYETGYEFYQAWCSDHFPRLIAVALQHPTPYADMSGALNSASDGPYGDAIVTELIPYIEKHFRTIGAPYARVLLGKSAGGRDALAQQLDYPDFFAGAWIFYPWAFEYQHYFATDVYDERNAFEIAAPPSPLWKGFWTGPVWSPLERYDVRSIDGQPLASVRQLSLHDAVMASKAGGEYGIDDAVLSPLDQDGYPRPLWDRLTGRIDHGVAQYWREHGDLAVYAESHWSTLGPKLRGKLHVYVGEMDEFYRERGVHHLESLLKAADPNFKGWFEYGSGKGHGWQPMTNAALVRSMGEYIERLSPASAPRAWADEP